MYTKGGVVFTTGCTDWAFGLRGHDPLIERITLNVIERLCAATPVDRHKATDHHYTGM
jgi:hypothetical protein